MATYTVASTQARKRFLSIVRDAGTTFARYVITHRGRAEAVVMSAEEFDGWLETLEIAESATWRKALSQARREDRRGKRVSLESLAAPEKPTRSR